MKLFYGNVHTRNHERGEKYDHDWLFRAGCLLTNGKVIVWKNLT